MGWLLWCLITRSAVSCCTFFKMVDNYSDSNTSNWDESADGGPSNQIVEAKRLGANLRTPEKANIARKRKLQTNPASKSRSTRGQSDPKLSSWQRVQEHKNEYLTSVDGKLRCDACKETISKKKSTVKKHISSLKHVKAKKTILESKKKDQSQNLWYYHWTSTNKVLIRSNVRIFNLWHETKVRKGEKFWQLFGNFFKKNSNFLATYRHFYRQLFWDSLATCG